LISTSSCVDLIAGWLGLPRRSECSSQRGIHGEQSDRLVKICTHFGASRYVGGDDDAAIPGGARA